MTRVAVIGGGASGMSAAMTLLDAGVDVTLIEAEAHLGGHCFPIAVPDGKGGRFHVDGGVTDFNEENFTAVRGIMSRLGLQWRPICQDAAVSTSEGQPVWSSIAGNMHLVAPFEDPIRFRDDQVRFARESVDVLSNTRFARWTSGEWLSHHDYGHEFIERAFIPRAGGAFPMPEGSPLKDEIQNIVRFWKIHGIVGNVPPRRMALVGGMNTWPRAFGVWFRERGGTLRLATRVEQIIRHARGVHVQTTDAHGHAHKQQFDHVVLAVPSHLAIGMLDNPGPFEQSTIGEFHWQRANVCVHSDRSLMGRERELWGAYNYTLPSSHTKTAWPTITFWANRLSGLAEELPDVFVSLNPIRDPAPSSIHAKYTVIHPILRESEHDNHDRLDAIQGARNTWFAGSWTRAPHVHESAVRSGKEAAEQLLSHLGYRVSTSERHSHELMPRLNWNPDTARTFDSSQSAFCPAE
jgi:predicted NAD/FAD-binding protein